MMLKVKLLAALAALMSMGCGAPDMPDMPATPNNTNEMAVSRQALKLEETPHTPESMPTLGWEMGRPLGLPAKAESAYLVMYKDPSFTNRFLAFGYDPINQVNLFVYSVLISDEVNFKNQWNLDVGQWKAQRATLISQTGTTDGIGAPPPPPRPQLDDMLWANAFHHYSIQTQIEQEWAHP
ncbi:MAG TPA: hypothetical protein VIG99_01365 [Myxococcaceae bacterium]|jgi:hypothetical protein